MSCVNTLKKNRRKVTPQRKLVIDAIHNTGAHLTVEKIIDYVHVRMPEVHKSTIYRTLELLEEAGCVVRSEWGDQFISHHAEEGHHHHLLCYKCGKTIECNEYLFSPVERLLVEKYGFHIHFKHVVMNGLCEKCLGKTS